MLIIAEMTVCHEASFKTETLLGNIQLAGSGDCVALPYARCSIAVWNLQDESNEVRIVVTVMLILIDCFIV